MRSIAKLMKDWQFTGPNGVTTAVELPHTWNARDGQDGGNDYWRGCCTYCTRFAAPVYDPAQQQVWLQFEGVNASAAVLLNGQQLCTHDGGYSTFRAEVTELLQAENQLTVRVDNSVNDRVYPQKADFTFYGGIYRDVSLLVVNKNHIALGHFGDTGVKITPALQENSADIQVETLVEGSGTVTVELLDAEGRTVAKGEGENAVEPVQGRRPPLCAAMQDHLRIRMGPEFVAQAFQFTPQLRRIVQFPVVHQNVPFPGPLERHGLCAPRRVHDGQPGMEQRMIFFGINALSVRPPPAHGPLHFFQNFPVKGNVKNSRNGAHH